ncbi:hypothetical protein GCM10027161_04920 [Microbispora hainanensis]
MFLSRPRDRPWLMDAELGRCDGVTQAHRPVPAFAGDHIEARPPTLPLLKAR